MLPRGYHIKYCSLIPLPVSPIVLFSLDSCAHSDCWPHLYLEDPSSRFFDQLPPLSPQIFPNMRTCTIRSHIAALSETLWTWPPAPPTPCLPAPSYAPFLMCFPDAQFVATSLLSTTIESKLALFHYLSPVCAPLTTCPHGPL